MENLKLPGKEIKISADVPKDIKTSLHQGFIYLTCALCSQTFVRLVGQATNPDIVGRANAHIANHGK